MTRIAAGLFFWLGALGFGAMAQATGPGGLRTLKVGARTERFR